MGASRHGGMGLRKGMGEQARSMRGGEAGAICRGMGGRHDPLRGGAGSSGGRHELWEQLGGAGRVPGQLLGSRRV